MSEVGGADFSGGEDGDEGCAVAGGFDVGAATLLAVDEAEDSGDMHSGFAGGFDGGNGGAAGGADIVDDDDVRAGFEEAFDFATGAVGLFRFANEEAVNEGGSWVGTGSQFELAREFEDFGVVGEGPGAGTGGVGDEGIGPHGETADGFGLRDVLTDEVVEDEAREATTFGVKRGGAAVDVVVGFLAAGEEKVAQLEGEGSDQIEKGNFVVGRHDPVDSPSRGPPLLPARKPS